MNGLPALASHLASKGRGEDSMLIHMTPGEVKGLQSLAMAHGGSLTINPSTGLPEAGFLKNILPTLIGVGASFLFPAAAPWMIGTGVGAFETLRTGDLGKGLMAGLGAFGGAGLGSALTSAGGQAAMSSEVARQAAGTAGAAELGTQAGADAILAAGARPETFMGNLEMAGKGFSSLGQPGGFSNLMTGLEQSFPTTTGKMLAAAPTVSSIAEATAPKYNFPTVAAETSNYEGPYVPTERDVRFKDEGDESTSEFNYFTPSNPVPGYQPARFFAASGGLMDLNRNYDDELGQDGYAEGGQTEQRGPIRMPGADYVAGRDPEFSHGFRPVEIQGMSFGGSELANRLANAPDSPGGKGSLMQRVLKIAGRGMLDKERAAYANLEGYEYDPQTQRLVKKAGGGLTALAAGGRYLKGPGDGTSDDIPAVIGNRQPARLADGEFVIDARTVSEIGNGSSNAGAKKLYAMMDRVHSARKKAKRGQDTKAERYMPA